MIAVPADGSRTWDRKPFVQVSVANVKLPITITSAHLVHVADPANGRTHFLPKPYNSDAVTELIGNELKQN